MRWINSASIHIAESISTDRSKSLDRARRFILLQTVVVLARWTIVRFAFIERYPGKTRLIDADKLGVQDLPATL